MHLDRGLLEFYLAEGSPLENDFLKTQIKNMFILWRWRTKYAFNKNDERNGRKCKEYVRRVQRVVRKNNHLIKFFTNTRSLSIRSNSFLTLSIKL